MDRILRDDADNNYAVRVRLKNTTKDVQKWQGAVVDPFGYATISDFARVMGAEGFRLYVRGAAGSADGSPDDPANKDERKAKRAAKAGK